VTWPRCPERFDGVLGTILSCDLPEGHAMDGEQLHRDPENGVHWTVQVDYDLPPRVAQVQLVTPTFESPITAIVKMPEEP